MPTKRAGDTTFTREHYEVFKDIYEKEEKRYNELINRGKIFLSIVTLYIGFFFLHSDKFTQYINQHIPIYIPFLNLVYIPLFIPFILGLLCFTSALILSVLSLGIYDYEGLCDIKRELKKLGNASASIAAFYEDRLADFAVASERNNKKNDRRARMLKFASYSILLGILLHMFVFISHLI